MHSISFNREHNKTQKVSDGISINLQLCTILYQGKSWYDYIIFTYDNCISANINRS